MFVKQFCFFHECDGVIKERVEEGAVAMDAVLFSNEGVVEDERVYVGRGVVSGKAEALELWVVLLMVCVCVCL